MSKVVAGRVGIATIGAGVAEGVIDGIGIIDGGAGI